MICRRPRPLVRADRIAEAVLLPSFREARRLKSKRPDTQVFSNSSCAFRLKFTSENFLIKDRAFLTRPCSQEFFAAMYLSCASQKNKTYKLSGGELWFEVADRFCSIFERWGGEIPVQNRCGMFSSQPHDFRMNEHFWK